MTYEQVLAGSAALLNDQDRKVYTSAVLLAYLNIALAELQELFELNNIPATNDESAKLDVPALTTAIGFTGGPPILPSDLIEIQRLYCSEDGQNDWVLVTPKEFLTDEELSTSVQNSFFYVWSWQEQVIKLISSIVALDLKIDYIKSLFPIPLVLGDLSGTLSIINASSFLQYRTAGLSAEYLGENPNRANSLNAFSMLAIDRALGIGIKGKQSIVYRRKPFRAGWKRRGILI